jgi:hypothetical protein
MHHSKNGDRVILHRVEHTKRKYVHEDTPDATRENTPLLGVIRYPIDSTIHFG